MTGYLALGAVLAVLLVLFAGVGQFAFGKADPRRSNRLMRLRVIAQAIALLLLVAAFAFHSAG